MPLVDIDEVRKAAMHSAAERAKLRRQQEETERERERERAKRKAAELEAKMKSLEDEKSAAQTQAKVAEEAVKQAANEAQVRMLYFCLVAESADFVMTRSSSLLSLLYNLSLRLLQAIHCHRQKNLAALQQPCLHPDHPSAVHHHLGAGFDPHNGEHRSKHLLLLMQHHRQQTQSHGVAKPDHQNHINDLLLSSRKPPRLSSPLYRTHPLGSAKANHSP